MFVIIYNKLLLAKTFKNVSFLELNQFELHSIYKSTVGINECWQTRCLFIGFLDI